jgi:acetyltransferase-like isoleucine patch superfamily enzyme
MNLSPIVLFVYNRPQHTQQTLEALSKNYLADQSRLYIYSDGPKSNADVKQLATIEEVRKLIYSKKWCKEVIIIESQNNKGLADSIIGGVSEVVNNHGKVIVLEDDIVTSRGFLKYMNDALSLYESENKVMHISGYMYPNKKRLPDTFFFEVPLCWGWATWKRSWKYFITDTDYLFKYFEGRNGWKRFNSFGGNYLKDQLEENLNGSIKTWFIKWHASVLINNGYTLYPGKSLVSNIGFDNSGIHCRASSAFKSEVADEILVERIPLKLSRTAKNIVIEFYQGKLNYVKKVKTLLKRIIPNQLKAILRKTIFHVFRTLIPEIRTLKSDVNWHYISDQKLNCVISGLASIHSPSHLVDVSIDNYSYLSVNSTVSKTIIGKFCSIGPNFLCGWGIHPVNGITTSPMFYSTRKQNGITLCKEDKVEERKKIVIGNDVFIGANVTVLDGVEIGDGAVIGAGAVVSKNIPPYAVAVGVPIKIIRYRFTDDQISKLLKIKWWDFDEERLKDVELMFFDVNKFIEKYEP